MADQVDADERRRDVRRGVPRFDDRTRERFEFGSLDSTRADRREGPG
ncbi:hypothetical protein [Halorarum salinum]|uniref:Uncharacterized protein n=1 Tax=Halorarum salinum TaxID=2743089 RepID=A0A7D5LAB9_9EURY|nr:hypothetical protein [Halobaculum salinum]QLG61774.1 hypothetical protein HUG12_08550 [Halobaculum salinum]